MSPPTSDATLRSINVLVCSCNLGNQQPDQDSLAAWIPYDGKLKDVTENQRYPVQGDGMRISGDLKSIVANKENPDQQNCDTEKPCFDIIVIGLQEATFEGDNTGASFPGISAAKKAHRAVAGLTLAKDHLKAIRQQEQTRKGRKFRNQNDGSLSFLGNTSQDGLTIQYPASSASMLGPSRPIQISTASSDDGTVDLSIVSGPDEPTVGASVPDELTVGALDVSIVSGLDVSTVSTVDASTASAPSQSDTKVLHSLFQRQLPSYKHAVSYQRGQMRLMLFHNENDIEVEVISIKAQNTGKRGLANKGGIVTEILVNGTTKLSFFTAHLEAHEGINKYEMRCSSVGEIFRGTTSTSASCRCDAALASHFTFAMGDLNFRTRFTDHEPGSESHIVAAHELVNQNDWERLYDFDELTNALETNQCFSGFSTPLCPFPPTFKVERRPGHAYNPKRSPSYTDRILFTTGHGLRDHLKVLAYEPIDEFASSDHKPIRGAFEVKLNPRIKWRPTSVIYKTPHGAEWSSDTSGFLMLAGSKPENALDKRESLHLFASSIEVQINKEHYRKNHDTRAPKLYVCFISTPAAALKKEVGRRNKINNLAATMTTVRKKLGRLEGVNGWPRTRRRKQSFDAAWDEMVHFQVYTHDHNENAIDLSGAIIHVAVLDDSSHDVVGIFPLNLAYLITQSRDGSSLKKTESHAEEPKSNFFRRTVLRHFAAHSIRESKAHIPLKAQEGEMELRDEDSSHHDEKWKKRAFSSSNRLNSLHDDNDDDCMTSGPSTEFLRQVASKWRGRRLSRELMHTSARQRLSGSSFDPTDVCSMKVNHPLRKNGVTVGHIHFTVDAWWLSDEAAARRVRGSGILDRMMNDHQDYTQ